QRRPRPSRRRRRAGLAGAAAGPGGRVRGRPQGRPGRVRRRARYESVRRPAAAAHAGARVGRPAAAAPPRRRHQRGRPARRGGDPRRPARQRPGVDPRGRLPPRHHRPRRRGRLPGARPGGRARPARGAAGLRARVRQPRDRLRAGRGGAGARARVRGRGRGGGGRMSTATVEARQVGVQERDETIWRTMRRGLALSPELRTGLAGTLALAVVSMAGRVAVPVAIQQGVDRGLLAPGGPDPSLVARVVGLTAALLVLTSACGYLMMVRLFTVTETALAGVRVRTFRHIHDLSMLHQQAERRGSLVSRVTSDVDIITQFLQFGGVVLLISLGQLAVALVVMTVYSWQLTLVVLAAFAPAVVVIRIFQRKLARAYGLVRRRLGEMLAAIGESIVGAEVIRAYGVAGRTAQRLDRTIDEHRRAQQKAIRTSVLSFSVGELAAGVALAGVVLLGVHLGAGGGLSPGQLTAFLFLVTLFIQPVQI